MPTDQDMVDTILEMLLRMILWQQLSWFEILCLLVLSCVLNSCPFCVSFVFSVCPPCCFPLCFPLCVSLHYLTCPLPSPLSSPVPDTLVSICIFSLHSPCTPCLVCFDLWYPPWRLCFLLCPVLYVYYFSFWFYVDLNLLVWCTLFSWFIYYFIFGLWMHFRLFSWFFVYLNFLKNKSSPFVSPISCLLCLVCILGPKLQLHPNKQQRMNWCWIVKHAFLISMLFKWRVCKNKYRHLWATVK